MFDIEKLSFVHPEEFVRVETEQGERLSIYSNVDRLEAELVGQAPQDAAEIRRLWPRKGFAILRLLPYLPLLQMWMLPICRSLSVWRVICPRSLAL